MTTNRGPLWAKVTDNLGRLYNTLCKAASQLHQWILSFALPNNAVEVELHEFTLWSGYSLRHARRAFHELLSVGLIEVVKDYRSSTFKLVPLHPDFGQKCPKSDKNVRSRTEMSETEGSNPHGYVPSVDLLKNNTDKESSHPPVTVVSSTEEEEGQESNLYVSENITPSKPTNPVDPKAILVGDLPPAECKEILTDIEAEVAPAPVTLALKTLVLESTVEVIENALAAVRQYRQREKLDNPIGTMFSAIRKRWFPRYEGEAVSVAFDLNQWLQWAYDTGLIAASFEIDGVRHVQLKDDSLHLLREFAADHPMHG